MAIITFLSAIILHYCFLHCKKEILVDEIQFWINVCLALFGSAALTVLTSLVSYKHEKIKTLENFLYHTRQLLTLVNKYQTHMTLEEKINFFLSYYNFDKIAWDSDFGNMAFFFESKTKDREYIYNKIYKPILDFNNAVASHTWHFSLHLDGSGKNDKVMQHFVNELETYLFKTKIFSSPTELDENGNPVSFINITHTSSKLVLDVRKELAGRYYKIMYGNKIYKRENAREAEEKSTSKTN